MQIIGFRSNLLCGVYKPLVLVLFTDFILRPVAVLALECVQLLYGSCRVSVLLWPAGATLNFHLYAITLECVCRHGWGAVLGQGMTAICRIGRSPRE